MNFWATALLWAMVQVTCLAAIGLALHAIARRRGPAAGALVSIGTLLAVLSITVFALGPTSIELECVEHAVGALGDGKRSYGQ